MSQMPKKQSRNTICSDVIAYINHVKREVNPIQVSKNFRDFAMVVQVTS